MQRSKLVAALVVAGVFAGGAALGYAGGRAADAARGGHPERDARSYWDQLDREWDLTPAQRRVIDSLMDAQRRKISALYRPLRPQWDSVAVLARAVSDSTQAELRTVLTPEQRVKLDLMRAEVRRRAAEHRARRDEELAKIR